MTDLDARVAALMSKIVNHRYVPIERVDEERAKIEQAIRAELQKPALHEPCTFEEITEALTLAYGKQDHYHQSTRDRMESALNHVLQGRAKPAQEEITDEQIDAIWEELPDCAHVANYADQRRFARAIIRASKGEKT